MAHQAHALPWNTLASNFEYNISYHHSSPHTWDIHPLEKKTQTKDLASFSQALAKQIQDFGITERAKYESTEQYKRRAATWVKSKPQVASGEGKEEVQGDESSSRKQEKKATVEPLTETKMVVPEEVVEWFTNEDSPEVLDWTLARDIKADNGARQRIEHWISTYLHIDEGNIVKILMTEAASVRPAKSASDEKWKGTGRECMDTLLLMANHPQMSLLSLRHQHWGHHFGVSRVAEEAVKAYVYWGLLVALRENGSDIWDEVGESGKQAETKPRRKYMDCKSYEFMVDSVAGHYDGDGHTLPHRKFFLDVEGSLEERIEARASAWKPSKDVLADLAALRDYLKGLWRLLVIYDVVIREAGGDPDWEKEFRDCLRTMFLIRKGWDGISKKS